MLGVSLFFGDTKGKNDKTLDKMPAKSCVTSPIRCFKPNI